MRIHDISMELRPGTPHWPGTTVPEQHWESQLANGDPYDLSRWIVGSHSGTHVDAPSHFFAGGGTIEGVPLDRFVGPARVVDIADALGAIDGAAVEALDLAGVSRVLFRTSNSRRRVGRTDFDADYVALTGDGAQALVFMGIQAVGLDYLSVERYGQTEPSAHLALLGSGIAVIEGCDLRDVGAGDYFLCCLPLRLVASEAAPARAILIEGWPG